MVKILYKIGQNIIQNWSKYYTKLVKIFYKIGLNIIQNWPKYLTKLVKIGQNSLIIMSKCDQKWSKTWSIISQRYCIIDQKICQVLVKIGWKCGQSNGSKIGQKISQSCSKNITKSVQIFAQTLYKATENLVK